MHEPLKRYVQSKKLDPKGNGIKRLSLYELSWLKSQRQQADGWSPGAEGCGGKRAALKGCGVVLQGDGDVPGRDTGVGGRNVVNELKDPELNTLKKADLRDSPGGLVVKSLLANAGEWV